jgi:hypothetical protein
MGNFYTTMMLSPQTAHSASLMALFIFFLQQEEENRKSKQIDGDGGEKLIEPHVMKDVHPRLP